MNTYCSLSFTFTQFPTFTRTRLHIAAIVRPWMKLKNESGKNRLLNLSLYLISVHANGPRMCWTLLSWKKLCCSSQNGYEKINNRDSARKIAIERVKLFRCSCYRSSRKTGFWPKRQMKKENLFRSNGILNLEFEIYHANDAECKRNDTVADLKQRFFSARSIIGALTLLESHPFHNSKDEMRRTKMFYIKMNSLVWFGRRRRSSSPSGRYEMTVRRVTSPLLIRYMTSSEMRHHIFSFVRSDNHERRASIGIRFGFSLDSFILSFDFIPSNCDTFPLKRHFTWIAFSPFYCPSDTLVCDVRVVCGCHYIF